METVVLPERSIDRPGVGLECPGQRSPVIESRLNRVETRRWPWFPDLPLIRGRESIRRSASGRDCDPGSRRPRIVHRTEHLPATSRVLYRIEHFSTLPAVGLLVIGTVIGGILVGASLGFPSGWVAAFEVSVSAVTLAMVFAIQHTQGREQAATQRKLDELLRALLARTSPS